MHPCQRSTRAGFFRLMLASVRSKDKNFGQGSARSKILNLGPGTARPLAILFSDSGPDHLDLNDFKTDLFNCLHIIKVLFFANGIFFFLLLFLAWPVGKFISLLRAWSGSLEKSPLVCRSISAGWKNLFLFACPAGLVGKIVSYLPACCPSRVQASSQARARADL